MTGEHNATLPIFVGFDPAESIAWHTMVASIYTHSSVPISITPLNLRNLQGLYTRPRDARQSNEFSYTRFLVPYLREYEGWAIYFDCDMMLRKDIKGIFESVRHDPGKAVYVVKHDYVPRTKEKYLGNVQYTYPRKNWSSVILWDCGHDANRSLEPQLINSATPEFLHRFMWLKDEQIGGLDISWNWLVGEYDESIEDVANVHWTLGGPYFREYYGCQYTEEWEVLKRGINFCKQRV
jgi:hypothetical protein